MPRISKILVAVLLLLAVGAVGAYAASVSVGIGIGGRHGGGAIVIGNAPYVYSPYAYAYPAYGYYPYAYPYYGYYPAYAYPTGRVYFSIPFGGGGRYHPYYGGRGWGRRW